MEWTCIWRYVSTIAVSSISSLQIHCTCISIRFTTQSAKPIENNIEISNYKKSKSAFNNKSNNPLLSPYCNDMHYLVFLQSHLQEIKFLFFVFIKYLSFLICYFFNDLSSVFFSLIQTVLDILFSDKQYSLTDFNSKWNACLFVFILNAKQYKNT